MSSASLTVVQSEAARRRLIAVHGADAEQVVVVPHGAAANFVGPVLSDIERPAVLTWGLLGPGKGIEHGISALSLLQETFARAGVHRCRADSPQSPCRTRRALPPPVARPEPRPWHSRPGVLRRQLPGLGVPTRVGPQCRCRTAAIRLTRPGQLGCLGRSYRVWQAGCGDAIPARRRATFQGAGLTVPQGDFRAMAAALEPGAVRTRPGGEDGRCLAAGGGSPAVARGRSNLPFPHRRGIAGEGGGVIETVAPLPSLRHRGPLIDESASDSKHRDASLEDP